MKTFMISVILFSLSLDAMNNQIALPKWIMCSAQAAQNQLPSYARGFLLSDSFEKIVNVLPVQVVEKIEMSLLFLVNKDQKPIAFKKEVIVSLNETLQQVLEPVTEEILKSNKLITLEDLKDENSWSILFTK